MRSTVPPIDWANVVPNKEGIRIPNEADLWAVHDDDTQPCPKVMIVNISRDDYLKYWLYWSGPGHFRWQPPDQVIIFEMESKLHLCVKNWFQNRLTNAQNDAGIPTNLQLGAITEMPMIADGKRPNGWYAPRYSTIDWEDLPANATDEHPTMVILVGVSQTMRSIQEEFDQEYAGLPLTRVMIGVKLKVFTDWPSGVTKEDRPMTTLRRRSEHQVARFYIRIVVKQRQGANWVTTFDNNVGNAAIDGQLYQPEANEDVLRLGMGEVFFGYRALESREDEELEIPLDHLLQHLRELVVHIPRKRRRRH